MADHAVHELDKWSEGMATYSVKIGNFSSPAQFVILDMDSDYDVILGDAISDASFTFRKGVVSFLENSPLDSDKIIPDLRTERNGRIRNSFLVLFKSKELSDKDYLVSLLYYAQMMTHVTEVLRQTQCLWHWPLLLRNYAYIFSNKLPDVLLPNRNGLYHTI